jgi:type IX secretion system PorP/SprF family membrane protein
MKNKIFIIHILIISTCCLNNLFGQQEPVHSLFSYDKNLYNPAFAGSSDWVVFSVKNRNQYVGMLGGPSTQTFNFHSPNKNRSMGVGLKVINDKIALMNNLNVNLSYSYHLNLGKGKLSLGLEGGIYNRNTKYQEAILTNPNDLAIPLQNESSMVPDGGWGVFFSQEEFYFGISQNHIFGIAFNDNQNQTSLSRLRSHLSVVVGNNFSLKNKKISISPNMMINKVMSAPTQVIINTIVLFDNAYGVGIQYRSGDAFSLIARISFFESLKLTYAYDITLSGLSNYNSGSHEILVSYGIKLPPPPSSKEVHPRYYF